MWIDDREIEITRLSEQAAALMKKAAKESDTQKTNKLLAAALGKLREAIVIADRRGKQ